MISNPHVSEFEEQYTRDSPIDLRLDVSSFIDPYKAADALDRFPWSDYIGKKIAVYHSRPKWAAFRDFAVFEVLDPKKLDLEVLDLVNKLRKSHSGPDFAESSAKIAKTGLDTYVTAPASSGERDHISQEVTTREAKELGRKILETENRNSVVLHQVIAIHTHPGNSPITPNDIKVDQRMTDLIAGAHAKTRTTSIVVPSSPDFVFRAVPADGPPRLFFDKQW